MLFQAGFEDNFSSFRNLFLFEIGNWLKNKGRRSLLNFFHPLLRCVCVFFTDLFRKQHLCKMEVRLLKLNVPLGLEAICTLS